MDFFFHHSSPKLIPLSRIAQLRKGGALSRDVQHERRLVPSHLLVVKRWGEHRAPREPPSPTEIGIRRLDEFSTSLVVEDVQEQHTGNYSCTVANAAGRDSGTTSLQVLCKY
ncbi:down syndrome cell adhesion molecule [Caerostris extrusa]|uniref:Down syndrome cell adhesion molecule n=1 Tax=Caerostris extrusa TaxID=172846 RepID=A0AAV4RNU7_CAEEX|nr:down syndrome cell adhesion molecule [Caerostris extrusa]